jgi:predicted nucleic acid-binding Zn ribbon protein
LGVEIMNKISNHIFDNLEHGRGRRRPVKKRELTEVVPGFDRKREKRHQTRPFPHQTLAAALKKALAQPAIKKRLSVVEIGGQWEFLFGETVAEHVQPLSLEKGVLVLQTDSSVWRHQISLMRLEILGKVRQQLGEESVKEIKVK